MSFHRDGSGKYIRSHRHQKAITNAIVDMVIKNIIPAHIVEKEGFQDLFGVLDPNYTIQCIQYTLVPEKAHKLKSFKLQLTDVPSCSVTLDIWSSRRICMAIMVSQLILFPRIGKCSHFCFAVRKRKVVTLVKVYSLNIKKPLKSMKLPHKFSKPSLTMLRKDKSF